MRIRTTMYAEFGLLAFDGVAMSASPSYLVQVWPATATTDPLRIKGSSAVSESTINTMTPTFSAHALNEPTQIGRDAGRWTASIDMEGEPGR